MKSGADIWSASRLKNPRLLVQYSFFTYSLPTGEVYACGMGSNLQLGNGDEDEDLHVPTKIISKQLETKKALKVAAGGQHTIILAVEK